MAVDKRKAERKLAELLVTLEGHRNNLATYSRRGDAAGVERCRTVLKLDHSRIRVHCIEHNLELPHDVPTGGEE